MYWPSSSPELTQTWGKLAAEDSGEPMVVGLLLKDRGFGETAGHHLAPLRRRTADETWTAENSQPRLSAIRAGEDTSLAAEESTLRPAGQTARTGCDLRVRFTGSARREVRCEGITNPSHGQGPGG